MKKSALILILIIFIIFSSAEDELAQNEETYTRTASTTTICNGITCTQTLYGGRMNYWNGTDYTPIIGTITEAVGDYEHEVITGEYQAYFKTTSDSTDLIKYVYNDFYITMSPLQIYYSDEEGLTQGIASINAVPGQSNANSFSYANAFGSGLNLNYTYNNEELTEDFIITTFANLAPKPHAAMGNNITLNLEFWVKYNSSKITVDGVDWDGTEKNTTEEILFRDDANNTKGTFKVPFAIDANLNSSDNSYNIKNASGKVFVTVKTPYSWLNYSGRSYPVKIDPTVVLQNNVTEVLEDATISSFGINYLLGGPNRNATIKFSQTRINIPIIDSTLYLTRYTDPCGQTGGGSNYSIWAYDNTSWKEGNHDYIPSTNQILLPELDNCTTAYDLDFNVTSWLQNRSSEGITNVSFVVAMTGRYGIDCDIFLSRHSQYGDIYRPYLSFTYLDYTAPSYTNWANNASSVTKKNGVAKFNITWSDTSGLNFSIFAHNQTGTLTNQTAVKVGGTSRKVEYNLTVTLSRGNFICGQFWINDSYNNVNQTNMSCFTVANTAPTAPTVTLPVNAGAYKDTGINFTSSDADSDAISYKIYINNTLNITTMNNITDWNASDGDYTLKISANDSTDTSANSTSITFYIDNKGPAYSSWGNDGPKKYGETITWTATLTDPRLSKYRFAHNQTGTLTNGSSTTASSSFSEGITVTLKRGKVICGQIWMNDTLGNFNQTNLSCFTVSNSIPTTPSVTYPVNGYNYTSIPYINYTSTDADNDTITFRIYINGTLNISTNVNITTWNASDGYYKLEVSANDSEFSSNSSAIYFTLDTKGPGFSANKTSVVSYNSSAQLNLTITDGNSRVAGYRIAYNKTQGALVNQTYRALLANPGYVSYNITEVNLTRGQTFSWQVWSNDTLGNVNTSQIYSLIIQNSVPFVSTDLIFTNWTAGHKFNVTATFTDLDTASDFASRTIENSSGGCSYDSNSTSGNDMTVKYVCTGTALVSATIRINATDVGGATINSSQKANIYPNQLPTVASAAINNTSPLDTSDLKCLNGSVADVDGDTVSLSYDWLKNEAVQNISSQTLSHTNLTSGDIWKCQIIPNDTYQAGATKTSAAVSIGTSYVAPIINYTYPYTTSLLESNSTNPTNNNSWVNLSVTFYDANNDKYSVWFCKADSATTGGCVAEAWCNASINTTNYPTIGCFLNVTGLTASSYNYYVFVADNTSLISASKSGTFHVNHYPTTPSKQLPASALTVNYTFVNYSSTDIDSDVINYTIYNSSDNSHWSVLNVNSTQYTWRDLADGTYYIKASSTDQHGYSNSENSSVSSFTVDVTAPSLNWVSVSSTAIYTTGTVTFTANLTDATAGTTSSACKFTLSKTDYNSGENFNISSSAKSGNLISVAQTMASYGSGDLFFQEVHCEDAFGNKALNSSVGITISITTPPTPAGGTGGSTVIGSECTTDDECFQYGLSFYCVESKCVKLTREDFAYLNLRERDLPEEIIGVLIDKSAGACNFDGTCELTKGENAVNCGDSDYVVENQKYVVEGDCKYASSIPGAIAIVFVIVIIGFGLLYIFKRRRV